MSTSIYASTAEQDTANRAAALETLWRGWSDMPATEQLELLVSREPYFLARILAGVEHRQTEIARMAEKRQTSLEAPNNDAYYKLAYLRADVERADREALATLAEIARYTHALRELAARRG
jgi:hypothetical protein